MVDRPSTIILSGEERETLERWARRHSSSQALALRCRIVLACADGDRTHAEIAAELGCNPTTVAQVAAPFRRWTVSTGSSTRPGRARRARSATT